MKQLTTADPTDAKSEIEQGRRSKTNEAATAEQ
jgi:hypothetical protein